MGIDRWLDIKDSEERSIIGTDVWDVQDPIARIAIQELQGGNTLTLEVTKRPSEDDVLKFICIDLYFTVCDV